VWGGRFVRPHYFKIGCSSGPFFKERVMEDARIAKIVGLALGSLMAISFVLNAFTLSP
jgi:hypothetical protein